MTSKEQQMIAVLQAFGEGKKVQARAQWAPPQPWIDDPDPSWNWGSFDYRVKPEQRRFWLNVYGDRAAYIYESKEEADRGTRGRIECIEVVEVLHD